MSKKVIRKLLENKVKSLDVFPTSWENVNFKPEANVAFQEVWLMLAAPENPSFGDDFYRQRGYLQIQLYYPQNKGASAAETRAAMLQKEFHRGLSLVEGGVTVTVEKTPEIGNGSIDGDRYVISVYIRFFANINPTE